MLMLLLGSAVARCQEQQSRDDAWWTGPMLAPSAATLPQGHVLLEPYVFDLVTNGHFDTNGTWHSAPIEHTVGSQAYMLYGITDRVTAGGIPRIAYNEPAGGADNSSGVGFGDLTLQAGYGLTRYDDVHRIPSIELVLQETLPIGQYDRLSRPANGFGAGAYTTAFAIYTQDYFWMPNGRILRARLDLTYGVSSSVSVENMSVYGTTAGFSGRAYPGDSFTADAAGEYSVTRSWVLALDVVYQWNGNTRVTGTNAGGVPFDANSGDSWSIAFAPAIEYNFSAQIGVLLGVRVIPIGRNTTSSILPVLALNMVF